VEAGAGRGSARHCPSPGAGAMIQEARRASGERRGGAVSQGRSGGMDVRGSRWRQGRRPRVFPSAARPRERLGMPPERLAGSAHAWERKNNKYWVDGVSLDLGCKMLYMMI
jgi:hypothetical protein